MPDEPNIPPSPPLRVTLLGPSLVMRLHPPIGRPGAIGCGVCRRPWERHPDLDIELCCREHAAAGNRAAAGLSRSGGRRMIAATDARAKEGA